MSTITPSTRTRTMSAMRRPASTSISSTTTSSTRSRNSTGGVGSDQTTPHSSVASRSSAHEASISPPPPTYAQGTARASPLARGATARAAVPPPSSRGANGIKRASANASPVPDRSESPAMSEALEGALRREVEEKEELMMRLANRDETISQLQAQITEMQLTMGIEEGRLAELYADQERWEAERAGLEEDIGKKSKVIEKLRIQLREIEKESRDSTRRLAEQAAQFESERQAFYDNTTHLKSRIQSLTDAQKEWKVSLRDMELSSQHDHDPDHPDEQDHEHGGKSGSGARIFLSGSRNDGNEEATEPPEILALRLELSTLGTSHGSLGQTVKMLQGQLAEVQRVNTELQEENEAFTTLLKEKTLSGQIDIMRHGRDESVDEESVERPESELGEVEESESGGRASMSPVESRRVVSHAQSLRRPVSPARSGRSGRSARRVAAETLADLPVAGPGLDLAAELGRAQTWDDGAPVEQDEEKEKKEAEVAKVSNAELEALRAEVKHLKDANKALSLYASKIIDRIISQEGFEHVLAIDYGDSDQKAAKPKPKPQEKEKVEPKPRPVSLFARAASLSISSPAPPSPVTATAPRPPLRISTVATEPPPAAAAIEKPEPATPMGRRERRGLSMDWSRFSIFGRGGGEPQTPVVDPRVANLKPLNLRMDVGKSSVPSSPIIAGGRKLDNQEDEEDRIERERLNAQMKLMGIEKEQNVHIPGAVVSTSGGSSVSGADTPASRTSVGWGRRPGSVRQDSSSSGNRIPTEELRAEHLELGDESQVLAAAAETRLAELDVREKALSAEIAKGRGGGFTEPPARGARVRRRGSTGSGSGASTLFSAGRLSRGGSEAGIGEEAEEEMR